MITLAKLKNAIFKTAQDVEGKSINIDLESIGGNTDDSEYYQHAGFHSLPHDDIMAIVLDVNGMNIAVATHDYKLNKTLEKGETLIYSYDADGVVLSSVKMNKTGEFVVNDGVDYAVLFDKLKIEFNELQQKHNDFVTTFNAHIHITTATVGATAVPGVIASTTTIETPSIADIDNVKAEKVRI